VPDAAVAEADVKTGQPQVAMPAMPFAAASAAAAADYDSVDQAIAAAARDDGAPLSLSRLNLVEQVTTVHQLSKSSNLVTEASVPIHPSLLISRVAVIWGVVRWDACPT
jgi:hypothetical protein